MCQILLSSSFSKFYSHIYTNHKTMDCYSIYCCQRDNFSKRIICNVNKIKIIQRICRMYKSIHFITLILYFIKVYLICFIEIEFDDKIMFQSIISRLFKVHGTTLQPPSIFLKRITLRNQILWFLVMLGLKPID